ncbi:hypothetical protein PAMP_002230 [Pampus punctatissimus]
MCGAGVDGGGGGRLWSGASQAFIGRRPSPSPGRLPARLKSPNEARSRYLIPDSLSQSDFAAEVIHPSGPSGPM